MKSNLFILSFSTSGRCCEVITENPVNSACFFSGLLGGISGVSIKKFSV